MKLPSSRKGQGLPMNVIVIIVILLVVAVILILIFTSKSKTIAKAGDCADQGGKCKTSCDKDERKAFFNPCKPLGDVEQFCCLPAGDLG